ncbi:hypothetical protein I131_07900 [Enterococcus faecium CRL1879]|nr:hypothetical protein I131_07900 [Enterococcus faecium CRL1879]
MKRFLSEANSKGVNPFTIWTHLGTATNATREVMALFSGLKIFSTPKPTELIRELLLIGANKSSVILDFFAGSSTTADAVMQLNAEDGGNR